MKNSQGLQGLGRMVAGSLVMASMLGAPAAGAADDLVKVNSSRPDHSVSGLKAAASQGDAQAMYQLSLLHIEGAISDADYDRGLRLLKRSAAMGNRNAQRMYAFMDNAFVGEGC